MITILRKLSICSKYDCPHFLLCEAGEKFETEEVPPCIHDGADLIAIIYNKFNIDEGKPLQWK